MTTVSIRLTEKLLKETDRLAKKRRLPRTEYIRQAIESMNRKLIDTDHYERLVKLSHRVRSESRVVNTEFDVIEDAPAI